MGVTAVNNDISFLKVGKEGLDEVVDWLTSHDKKHNTAGFLELRAELFERVGTLNRLSYTITSSVSNFSVSAKDWELRTLCFVG
jgi:hypothetical protein